MIYSHTHYSMLLSGWVKMAVHPKTEVIRKMAPGVIQDFRSPKDPK